MKEIFSIWNRLIGDTYDAVKHKGKQGDDGKNESCLAADKIARKQRTRSLSLIFLGMVLILSGGFMYVAKLYDTIFKYKITFGPGGEIFELWRLPPVDLYLRVFLWNVTNAEEYMSGKDDKLKVQEVGPYVYRELMTHENVTFNPNGTVSAIPKHPLVWVPELSEGRQENDLLILPNIALLSITQVVSDENSYFTKLGLNMLIRQIDQQPLVQMTARDFMFDYSNALMQLGNNFMPNWIYFKTLGLIDRMYDFEGDYETVYTGETDWKKAGLLDTFHGSTKIPQWDNPCGNIQGASDGTKFPSFIQPDEKLFFYRKSMCRSKYLIHVNDTHKDGFDGYVYNFDDTTDDNGKYNEQSKCFCKDPSKYCLPPGLLDVHGCYYGFPIALSTPHFMNAQDPFLTEKVIGYTPNPEEHSSYFVIEPTSGVPLELRANFQINMALRNLDDMAHVERFSNMVLPLLWAEFRMFGLPDILKSKLTLYIKILPVVDKVCKYGSIVLGFLILAYALYKLTKVKNSNNRRLSAPWMQEEMHFIKRKLSNYLPERRNSKELKDMQNYYTSLIGTSSNGLIQVEESNELNTNEVV